MVPFVGVPNTIAKGMSDYRAVFCRESGFKHVSRYISGLLLSENKSVQGSYSQQVYLEEEAVVTAVIVNPQQIDGIAVEVQLPNFGQAERGYLKMTAQPSYEQMEQVMQRLVELLHDQKNQLAYRKRTEIVVDSVRQIEAEGQFTKADYPFDNGVLTLELTRLIAASAKHWVTQIECSRLILWNGQWCRVDGVATQLRYEHPQSFRRLLVRCRNREVKVCWAFTKTVRWKRYRRKRLVIVHQQEDLNDTPRFLLTDALHWESARVIQRAELPLGLREL